MEKLYYRLTCGLNDIGKLIPKEESVYDHIDDLNKAWYKSIYFYNETQKEEAEEIIQIGERKRQRGISSMVDVVTNKLVFDFDDKDNIENARKDTIVVCERLLSHGLSEENLQICFSGKKGFAIEIDFKEEYFNPKEVKNLVNDFIHDIDSADAVVVNASRIFRVPLTKHGDTNYYKTPLSFAELNNSSLEDIFEISSEQYDKSCLDIWEPCNVPESFHQIKTVELEKPKVVQVIAGQEHDLDFSKMPKGFSKWKYALMNGYFPEGTRSIALTILASTFRYLGYPEKTAYYMLKGAADSQSERFGCEKFSKNDIWTTVMMQVYGPQWRGACYSEDNFPPQLQKYLIECGIPKTRRTKKNGLRNTKELFSDFKDFAENIEANTIKTGIDAIDKNTRITTGMLFGLLGGAGSGKCLGKDTPVIMYDGTIKMVQDVKTNDLLMGDDSTPRKVLSTCSGKEQLYKVKQKNGDNYVVNASHILSLKTNMNSGYHQKGDIIDMNVEEYIGTSNVFKKKFRGYKVGVDYNKKEVPVDPYYLGLWLGDGSAYCTTIYTTDCEIVDYVKKYANELKLKYSEGYDRRNEKMIYSKIVRNNGKEENTLRQNMIKIGVLKPKVLNNNTENYMDNDKCIPDLYLINDRDTRLRVLAGLIDSDGHAKNDKYTYNIVQKRKKLSYDILKLIRSLGYKATLSKVMKSAKNGKDIKREYYSIYFNGNEYSDLIEHIKLKRKHAKTNQRVDKSLSTIEIEKLEVGDYYGFEIDGNHRFLLGDFTVTHNTSVALTILNQCSLNNVESLMFSMDMNSKLIYQKLGQKHTGMDGERIFDLFKDKKVDEIKKLSYKIDQNYLNSQFEFQTALAVEDMKNTILEHEEATEKKVKLVVVDYLECIVGPFSDPTANGGFVANALKDVASDLDICVLLLLQTQKASGDVSEPLRSMRKVKGSSVLEQACSIIIALWREGFNPKDFDQDKFMTFCCVKNRMGRLFEVDCGWEGITGEVLQIPENEKEELEELRKAKMQMQKIASL